MEKSSKKTSEAIKKNFKIGIFGDYDVDGASSTALLGNYFNSLGLDYETYIPDRKKEGYGPSISAFKYLIECDVKLIFTVDCGTLSFRLSFASQNNIDVIVLDHHQSEIKLQVPSIVNPNRIDDKSNLNYLCAAESFYVFFFE